LILYLKTCFKVNLKSFDLARGICRGTMSVFLIFCSIHVFSQHVDSVLYFNGNSSVLMQSTPSLSPINELSISCWLRPDVTSQNNSPEPLLSKRFFAPLGNITDMNNWEWHDATNATSMNDVKGFVGAVYDGRYLYCSPWYKDTDAEKESGKVLRYDTHLPYDDDASWVVYDAEHEDGFSGIRGLEGAVFDGKYVYFVPLHHEGIYWAKVLRYDISKEFTDPDSWEVFNAESLDPEGTMAGFVGATFDGKNIYFIPNPFSTHGKVLRFNTTEDFFSESSWDIYDLSDYDPDYFPDNGFFGGVFDGQYLYFVPFNEGGKLLRLNTKADFHSRDSWTSVTFESLFPNSGIDFDRNFSGGVFDGRYIYFSPVTQGSVVRFDTRGEFDDSLSWEMVIIKNIDGINGVYGGVGPVFDGRYVYIPPMHGIYGRSGKFVMYDTYKEFTDLNSWGTKDLGKVDFDLRGFEGGVFDGQHVYFVPMNFQIPHGKIVRYNTTPKNEISYQLHYNKTSSSFGSVAQSLVFEVGTTLGVRSITLHHDHNFADNQWHHITATYDGNVLQLYFDGALSNTASFAQTAMIISDTSNLSIGKLEGAHTGYRGHINDLGIWNKVLPESDILKLIAGDTTLDSSNLQAMWTFDQHGAENLVQDVTPNNNNSIENESILYRPEIYAGADLTICASGIAFELEGWYPEGGEWSGTGVSKNGFFFPSPELAGTEQTLTYTIKRNYSGVIRTISATKVITLKAGPQISAPNDVLCIGSEMTLTAQDGFADYKWNTGQETQSIVIDQPGVYSVGGRELDGDCYSSSVALTINQGPYLPTPQIEKTDFYTLTSAFEGTDYQWFRNDTLLANNDQFLKVFEAGEYRLRVQDVSGCSTVLSSSLVITEGELEALRNEKISIFPNPAREQFQLAIHGTSGTANISIVNSVGETAVATSMFLEDTGTVLPVDVANLSAGMYLIQVKTADFSVVRRLVLK
jgi:hypothetical protein